MTDALVQQITTEHAQAVQAALVMRDVLVAATLPAVASCPACTGERSRKAALQKKSGALNHTDGPHPKGLPQSPEEMKEKVQATQDTASCLSVGSPAEGEFELEYAECELESGVKLSGKLSVDLKEKEATVEITAVFDQTAVGDATLTGTLSGTVDVQVVKATASVELAASEPLTVSTADASTTVALDVTVGVAKAEPTSVDGTATVTWNGTDYSCAITGVKIHASDGAPHAGTLAVTYDPEQGRSLTVEVVFSEATVTDGTVEVKVNGISLGTMTAEDVKALLEAAGAESS